MADIMHWPDAIAGSFPPGKTCREECVLGLGRGIRDDILPEISDFSDLWRGRKVSGGVASGESGLPDTSTYVPGVGPIRDPPIWPKLSST